MKPKQPEINDWLDQLADLIIDCFLWEWKSGRLANGDKDSYIKNTQEGKNYEKHNK